VEEITKPPASASSWALPYGTAVSSKTSLLPRHRLRHLNLKEHKIALGIDRTRGVRPTETGADLITRISLSRLLRASLSCKPMLQQYLGPSSHSSFPKESALSHMLAEPSIMWKRTSTTELECLAVLWGIRRMREYLEGYFLSNHRSPSKVVTKT